MTRRYHPVPDDLQKMINDNIELLPEPHQSQLKSLNDEPWKQAMLSLVARLPSNKDTSPFEYKTTTELTSDLIIMKESLLKIGAARLANEDLFKLLRLVNTLVFMEQLLDIRQNSAFHEKALQQLIHCAGIDLNWFELTETQRLDWLNDELLSPRPLHIRVIE